MATRMCPLSPSRRRHRHRHRRRRLQRHQKEKLRLQTGIDELNGMSRRRTRSITDDAAELQLELKLENPKWSPSKVNHK